MSVNGSDNQTILLALIKEVKPSLGDHAIKLEDSLVENLGLDSLDITQLARKVRRNVGAAFDPQAWAANHVAHNYSVKSLLDAMAGTSAPKGQQEPAAGQQTLSA
jgi:acyl carrier protein